MQIFCIKLGSFFSKDGEKSNTKIHLGLDTNTYTHACTRTHTTKWASEGLQMKCLLILYEIFRWRFSIALSLVFSEGVFEYSII